jgi:AcrR family transcriptional regulator
MRRSDRLRAPLADATASDGSDAPAPESRGGTKRELRAQATQERLLDVAAEEFAARGFAGARLREIARGVGVQPALIHHYFIDKQGLYEAVIRRVVDDMSVASWKVLESATGLEAIVHGFVDVMVEFASRHHKMLALLRGELLSGETLLVEVLRERTVPLLEAVVAIAERLQAEGELRSDLSAREMVRSGLSLILYPAVDAVVLDALLPQVEAEASLERRKRVVASVLLGGIRAHRQ